MASFLDVCRFNPTAGSTTDFTYLSAVTGYQSPTAAGAVNGAIYRYRAESADLSQWEVGYGAFNTGTGVLSRSTVLFNSAGTTAKISFTVAPQVSIVALAEDLTRTHTVTPGGRLTLTSGTPITTTDVTAATTVYYTPGAGPGGDVIALWDGSNWLPVTFAETSLSLSGLTASTNYDLWGRISAGVLALDTTAWTSSTVRATAIAQQNGIDVKSGDATRRLLGTFRITGTTGQTEDSIAKRYVSNRYNDAPRPMLVTDPAATWTYNTATWRQANANTANQLDYVCCVARPVWAFVQSTANHSVNSASSNVMVGVGVDAIPAASNALINCPANITSAASFPYSAYYAGTPGVGRHFLAWIEYGSPGAGSTIQQFGTILPFSQSGIVGGVSN